MTRYYIEGEFVLWWGNKSYNCNELNINVPKYATEEIINPTETTPGRIYINARYIYLMNEKYEKQTADKWYDKNDYYFLKKFVKAVRIEMDNGEHDYLLDWNRDYPEES